MKLANPRKKPPADGAGNLLLFPTSNTSTTGDVPSDKDWSEVKLKIPGGDKPFCGVDFETYFDSKYSLEKMTTWEYVSHESFDAYLVALCRWFPSTGRWMRWVGHPRDAKWAAVEGVDWVSHNAAFDELVMRRLLHDKVVKCKLPPHWYCTADLAAYHQVPRNLAESSKLLLGLELDKSTREKMKAGTVKHDELRDYAAGDAYGTAQLWAAFGKDWPPVERIVSEAQRRAGWRGVALDTDLIAEANKMLGGVMTDIIAKLPWTGREVVASKKGVAIECAKHHISPPPSFNLDDPDTEKWQIAYYPNYSLHLSTHFHYVPSRRHIKCPRAA